jgi:hypothetical protein
MTFEFSVSSLVSSSPDANESSQQTGGAQSVEQTAAKTLADAGSTASNDTVSISGEAYRQQRAAAFTITAAVRTAAAVQSTTVESPWKTYFNLESGSKTLANGHTQVTAIDGADMERLEYKGGVLVKKETGTVVGGRAVWDTEHYDVSGAVTRKDHVELTGLGSTDTDSVASMRRDVQWFENGALVRELHDGMHVEAASQLLDMAAAADLADGLSLDDMAGKLTKDRVQSDYQASIAEYANGRVTRTASIHNGLEAENVTNRSADRRNGLDGHTSVEVANANALTVELTSYDMDGNVAVQSRFTDSVEAGKGLTQTVAVSWYDKGELVREEEGSLGMTLIPGKGQQLPDRPGILETFGIDEKTFSGRAPLSADGLLGASREESGGAADVFVDGVDSDMAAGAFGLAETLADYRDADNPYRATFSSRTYRDGELAAVSTDTEEVRENRLPGVMQFATGRGLTEDEFPATLRSASHEEIAYENGERSAQGRLFMREYLQKDDRGVYGLNTYYSGEAGQDGDMESASGVWAGSLETLDSDANAATAGMGRAAGLAVDDMRSVFSGLARG